MGTLTKMRTISPYVLVGIAVLFIAFMVISDIDMPSIMSRGQNSATAALGKVNGEKILYADFEKRVREQADQARAQNPNSEDFDEAPVREQVWNEMTDEILLRQEAKRMGITVSNDEILDILLQDPPQFLRQQFTDSLGRFNRELYLEIVTNPDVVAQRVNPQVAADFKKMLIRLEDYIRLEKLQSVMRTSVASATGIIDPTYMERRFALDNATVDVDFIQVGTQSVPDAKVSVSEQEISEYYSKYQTSFKQKPVRRLKYILLPMVPSQADSQKVQKRLERLNMALAIAQTPGPRDTAFENLSSEFGGQINDFKHVQDITPQKMAILAGMQPREVVGPIGQPTGGVSFIRLDAKRSGVNELVKASHILIAIKPNENKDSAKAEAQKIFNEAKNGGDFAELAKKYSADKSNAQKGGDLPFFGKGAMVKPFEEAAMSAAVGSIIGPVETQFGFHIIHVTDKKSDEIKFTELSLVPIISQGTKNTIFRQAQMIKEQGKGLPIDTIAARMKVQAQPTAFFRRATAVLGLRSLTNFAFDNDLNAYSDPVELKGSGVIVAQVTDSRIAGIKPLVDVKEDIKARLVQGKKLDVVKAQAEDLFKKVSGLDSLKKIKGMDSTVNVQTAAALRDNGSVPGAGLDMSFTGNVFLAQPGKIVGPVRCERGYYVFQVTKRNDVDMKGFAAQRASLLQNERNKAQGASFFRWKNELRDRSDIEDNRSKFFRE